MTTVLHLVRHGSHGRLNRQLCGRMEGVELSAEGRAEAARTAARLRRERPAAIRSSPVQRCRETAEILGAALGLTVETDDRLTEIDFGAWTGLTFDQLHADPRWAAWNGRRTLARPPAGDTPGESLGEAQMRAVAAAEDARAAWPEAAVALVTHSDIVKALACHWLGLGLDAHGHFEVAPASLTTAAVGDWGAKLIRLNEETPA